MSSLNSPNESIGERSVEADTVAVCTELLLFPARILPLLNSGVT
jgi:hypothetical protein